ncbi:MAG: TaqI-like C-terminal specificity domain-containing protein, partial [Bacteroidota bacterium]|nr:TaqI-like C-terminal specificity domain-containing protein [Bacteroidota bacterium]
DGWENQTARQLASWDPYDQNESSSFFDMEWMFDIKEGFDVVIGNPPYGAKFTDEEKTLFKKIFKHQDYQPESFLFFTEKSIELLKYGAVLSFIIPNTWLTNLKLIKIRKFLTADNAILNISHYHKSVFDAVVDTEVVIFRKGYVAQNQVNVFIHETTDSILKIAHNQDKWKEHNGEVINIFSNKKIEKVIDSIKNNTFKINELCNVVVGMKPYQVGKGKPKQDRHCVENRIFDSELKVDDSYRRLLRGRDIEKYKINWDGKRWIKFGDWLAEPRYSANFEAIEKIVLRQTGDSLIASLDTTQFICMNNLHVLTNKSDSLSLRYILALLNSSLLNFYFQYLNPEIGEALAEVKKETVEKLLIKETSNQKPFITLVDQILTTKKENSKANTTILEQQLDEMVFKLYELTYEEVKIVDPDFWLSEAEYAAIEL